jgi:hypothetical protein
MYKQNKTLLTILITKKKIDDIMKKYDIRTTSTFYTIINPKNQEKIEERFV